MTLDLPSSWRTRFAPAPTGYLHLGHAVNAVYVWGLARAFGGTVVLRVEDHDRIRSRPKYETALLEELDWLGLEADEVAPPQRERGERYGALLAELEERGLAYPCVCTRREIRAAARKLGRDGDGEIWYPGSCRRRALDPAATAIRRLALERREAGFRDRLLGDQRQIPAEQCGDLALRDRDGNWTYHFAVVVDDLDQGIDVVIRGQDLLDSTGRQIQAAEILGRPEPAAFLHHPLVLKADGSKLSKSNRDTGLRELRRAGWSAERVLGEAARLGGLMETAEPLSTDALTDVVERRFAADRHPVGR